MLALYIGIGLVLNVGLQPKKISIRSERNEYRLIAHDSKKTLMQNFCIAYRGILSKHELYATGTTGRLIEEVTNLNVHKYLAGPPGERNSSERRLHRMILMHLIFLREPLKPKPHEPDQ